MSLEVAIMVRQYMCTAFSDCSLYTSCIYYHQTLLRSMLFYKFQIHVSSLTCVRACVGLTYWHLYLFFYSSIFICAFSSYFLSPTFLSIGLTFRLTTGGVLLQRYCYFAISSASSSMGELRHIFSERRSAWKESELSSLF